MRPAYPARAVVTALLIVFSPATTAAQTQGAHPQRTQPTPSVSKKASSPQSAEKLRAVWPSLPEWQAERLVLLYLQDTGVDIWSIDFFLEPGHDPYFPDDYAFAAYYDWPTFLSGAGNYLVDPRTADLCESTENRRVSSPRVRHLQQELRKKPGLSQTKYVKLSKEWPCGNPPG